MSVAMGLVTALVGSLAAFGGLYLLAITAAAATYRNKTADVQPSSRLAVLVPAHNEESSIARCVESIRSQSYPHDLYRVVVIADNCDDQTATVARAAGAEVLVRDAPDARGKGQALRWAIDQLVSATPTPDALVFVDADSVAEPNLLVALEAELAAGADAAQADYHVLSPDADPVRSAALLLFNRIRSQGRQALGLPAQLLGNGMLISLRTLERVPWHAFSPVEDLEYSIALHMAGFKVSFTPEGRVLGPLPPSSAAATTQRLRWEGGRLVVLRSNWRRLLGRALRRRDVAVAEVLIGLAVPPLALLGFVVAVGTTIATALALWGGVSLLALVPWTVAAVALASHVLGGLRIAHARAGMYRGLLRAPLFVVWKIAVYARLARGGFDPERWDRTARAGELRSDSR